MPPMLWHQHRLSGHRGTPQTGGELSLPEKPVFQLRCAAKATEREMCHSHGSGLLCFKPKGSGFLPSLCCSKWQKLLQHLWHPSVGLFTAAGTGHRAQHEKEAACGAMPELFPFPMEREAASSWVSSTVLPHVRVTWSSPSVTRLRAHRILRPRRSSQVDTGMRGVLRAFYKRGEGGFPTQG